jgi:hypothetical protein
VFQRRPESAKHIPDHEQGFALIAAIWLLVLGGAIVAVIMLRTMTASRAAVASGVQLADKLALDGAIDSVVADILFNGNRSRWAQLPSNGSIDVGGRSVSVTITSENGLLDINEADPKLIDGALRGFGVSAGPRAAFIDQLLLRRVTKQPLRSRDELLRVIAVSGVQASGEVCLVDMLTVSSGLATPQVDQMPAKLARAMGVVGAGSRSAQLPVGGTLRVLVRSGSGMASGVVVRPIANKDDGPQVLDRWVGANCGDAQPPKQ